MIYTHNFNGLALQTGDILCTSNGTTRTSFGRFWRLIGYLVPGPIDHAVLYIGPQGRCVEAGGKGVTEFTMPGNTWDAPQVAANRLLEDTLVGVAYPPYGLGLLPAEEERIRTDVANYCLDQLGKPYNPNFLNTATTQAFYCSQLIYLAYRASGIDLGVSPVGRLTVAGAQEAAPLLVLPTAFLTNCPHELVKKARLKKL